MGNLLFSRNTCDVPLFTNYSRLVNEFLAQKRAVALGDKAL